MSMDVAALTITQLTGIRDKLELKGRALPYQGLSLEGKQRVEITRYPGNPVASMQMLGSELAPTTIQGMWKDRFLKSVDPLTNLIIPEAVALWNGTQVRDVMELVEIVESLRMAGQLVEVAWAGGIKRRGVITRFRQNWIRAEDVEWEIDFEWMSRGDPQLPVTFPLNPLNDFVVNKLLPLASDLKAAIESKFEIIESFKSTVYGLAQELDNQLLELQDALAYAENIVTTPEELMRRTIATIQSIKSTAQEIVDLTLANSGRAVRNVKGDIAALGFGEVQQGEDYTRAIRDAARSIRTTAAENADRLKTLVDEEELLAVFSAREDMDLRQVSIQYYGSPDEWRRLRKYNGFSSSRLVAGDLVLVPKINNPDRGA